ncbi:hypothetical protein BKA56DRAFT_609294 [Ilyonectria sp. MPI-CAGE-AT-0026]|nr:hypothetical protein BKA56DRAFT_609294 [Ilyonectria sp. MPI-CAGE-AT-0026]
MSGQPDQGLSPGGAPRRIGFNDLPPEMRQHIWKAGAPATIHTFFVDKIPQDVQRGDALDISQVNAESRISVQKDGCWLVDYDNGQSRQSVQINLIHDVVFIEDGMPPLGLGDDDGSGRLQKIASVIGHLKMTRDIDYTTEPLGELEIFGFNNIREYTVLSEHSERLWIDGCQMLEPQVVGVDRGFRWYGNCTQDPDSLDQAARYFEQKGIPGDTGIKWPLENVYPLYQATNMRGWTLHEEVTQWRRNFDAGLIEPRFDEDRNPLGGALTLSDMPRIGHMGYSMNETSVGGNWAGFRYFTDTMRVEFTPLAFADIEGLLTASWEARRTLPELVAHIWVVRPGEEGIVPNESYHAWEEVKPYSETEDERDGQIRRLWQLTRDACQWPSLGLDD